VPEVELFQKAWQLWVYSHGTSGDRDPDAYIHEMGGYHEDGWAEWTMRLATEDIPTALNKCVIA
jgi:hypothetical protein